MKQPRGQCIFKDPRTQARCTSPVWKAGERLCTIHEIAETLKTAALDRMLKHHPKHCTYWIFSGDRHCSCGRDKAIQELSAIKSMITARGISLQTTKTTNDF